MNSKIKNILIFTFTYLHILAFGQNSKITITVKVPNQNDNVYIVGNQNDLGNWNPNKILMKKKSKFERIYEFTPSEYPVEFKFTKGSWESEAEILNKFDNENLKINNFTKDTIFPVFRWISDSRLAELKKAKRYNLSDNRFVPKFQYQDKNHPSLVKLRTQLKLDSIAGNGNELSKVFNVLDWLHRTIHHDCCTAFDERNAINLIQLGKEKGMNCRMLAITLNECYLSLGIKSRYVTCMPKEKEFMDCHVINMVYINDLHKWIWIDPSNGGFAMNEKGDLLSIEEVRKRLINDKPIILNANASWEKENLETTQHYFYKYMAKNLYRLECPLVSEYDTETWNNGKEVTYVELLPLDAINQEPQKTEYKNSTTGTKFICYKTNNPNIFWENP